MELNDVELSREQENAVLFHMKTIALCENGEWRNE